MAGETLTRLDLAEAVFREVGLSRNESADLVESVLQHISDALVRGESVKISSFGTFGIRDKTFRGEVVGCEDLLKRIQTIKPKYFIFGHIHEEYGIEKQGDTTFINASVLDEMYHYVNKPIEIEI